MHRSQVQVVHGVQLSRVLARLVWLLMLSGAALLSAGVGTARAGTGGADPSGSVLATEVATSITPVVADQVSDALGRAQRDGYAAYVIEMDTPGGLAESMRHIVQDVLASDVPVIVYVTPHGARAASAGAYITYASHVAVMAPGTEIGAATPVDIQGGDLSDKVVNDAAAQARSLAELRGRNVTFAVESVTKGRSASARQAVDLDVVDGIAGDLEAALRLADGHTVTVSGDRQVTVHTAGATVVRDDMGPLRSVLQFLANPNIAYLLLTIGTLGLIYELMTPGIGIAGTTGATALILALFSLSVLPVNIVGILLLLLAAGLFVAELFVPGIGGFAFGGAVLLVLSAFFLFDASSGVSVDLWAVLPLALVLFVGAVVAGQIARRTRHEPSTTTGSDVLLGHVVEVRQVQSDGIRGSTFAAGAWWSMRSTRGPLRAGGTARVIGIDGLTLLVEPVLDAAEDAESQAVVDAPRDPTRMAGDEQ